MLRPREAIARYRAFARVGSLHHHSFDDPHRGIGCTIAMIDAMPDLATEELVAAGIEAPTGSGELAPDPHATFAASVLVGRLHGLVPGARLLVAPVMDGDPERTPERIAAAIAWATQAGARILVIPLGDVRAHACVGEAILAARAKGVVIVAAAGNAHPRPLLFPAAMPEVVAVGACDEQGRLLDDSCRVPRLDLVLPALRILAATGPGREAQRSGTSVAATLAAGLLALDSPAA